MFIVNHVADHVEICPKDPCFVWLASRGVVLRSPSQLLECYYKMRTTSEAIRSTIVLYDLIIAYKFCLACVTYLPYSTKILGDVHNYLIAYHVLYGRLSWDA